MTDATVREMRKETGKFILRHLFVFLLIGMTMLLPNFSFAIEATLTGDAYTYSILKATKYGTQAILSVRGAASGATLKRKES